MKKIICLFMFSCLLLFSQQVLAQRPNSKESLPPKGMAFLDKHFKNYEVYRVKYSAKNGEYEVKLKSGHQVEFDYDGDWIEIDGETQPLPKTIIDMLPPGIIQYIAKKYTRRAIIKIEREAYGYEIELSNSVELLFDHKGKFLKED